MTTRKHNRKTPHRFPERCRNVRAFARAILSRRSSYAISTNQMRLAFSKAIGMTA